MLHVGMFYTKKWKENKREYYFVVFRYFPFYEVWF